ncbi:MAG: hypothetical protein K2M64_04175, partial [Clostridia bacterium]|nr:hypothetical protein [Clostridia bacterium]
MAIVTIKKLTLLAMQQDKESIFDALVRTNSVEIKRSADVEACTRADVASAREKYAELSNRAEEIIRYVSEQANGYNKSCKRDKSAQVTVAKESFTSPLAEVNYDYFLNFGSNV